MENNTGEQGEMKRDEHQLYLTKENGSRYIVTNVSVQQWGLTVHNEVIVDEEGLANAERLKTCWNACNEAGLTNGALEAGVIKDMIKVFYDVAIYGITYDEVYAAANNIIKSLNQTKP